ncbi:hypothetical protein GCM10008020_00840 [Massilia psychrophila]|nr:hypothetical protein GCM10008020_00840 [Massilia psychrophila]
MRRPIRYAIVTNFNRARALPSYIAVTLDIDKPISPGAERRAATPGQDGPDRVPDRRALRDRFSRDFMRRTLKIGVSARIFHPAAGSVGLRSKNLQYLEESIA